MNTLNSSPAEVRDSFNILQSVIDAVQDTSVTQESLMDSDDEQSRTYHTALPLTSHSDGHLQEYICIETITEPFQRNPIPPNRSVANLPSAIDDLFGQLSMYPETLPPLLSSINIDGPESADTGLVNELPPFRSGSSNDILSFEEPQLRSDNTHQIYGLVDARLSKLENVMDGINGSLTNLAGVVLENISIRPPLPPAPSRPAAQTAYLPKRRPAQVNALAREVRLLLKTLLGPRMFDIENMMSSEEIDAFVSIWSTHGKVSVCCDIQNFKIDFHGSPRSAWNQSACRVFTNHFVQTHGATSTYTQVGIQLAFYKRVQSVSLIFLDLRLFFYCEARSLQTSYRNLLSSQSVVAEAVNRQKRLGRMRSLFRKRVCLASQHPMLAPHLGMLNRIGIQGMSSDESDFEEKPPKYHVHKPRWRSPELSSWLHAIDQLESYFRTMTSKPKGALPRLRIHSATGPVSDKRFVLGLPKSAYNELWLSGLVDPTHDAMITDEIYQFTHDNRLFSYFNTHNRS